MIPFWQKSSLLAMGSQSLKYASFWYSFHTQEYELLGDESWSHSPLLLWTLVYHIPHRGTWISWNEQLSDLIPTIIAPSRGGHSPPAHEMVPWWECSIVYCPTLSCEVICLLEISPIVIKFVCFLCVAKNAFFLSLLLDSGNQSVIPFYTLALRLSPVNCV